MTDEILTRGNELTKRIGEVKDVIKNLSYRKEWSSKRRYIDNVKWTLKLFNRNKNSYRGNKENPMIVVFDNVNMGGSEIVLYEEDSELLDIIIEYYNKKRKKLEEELASL